MSDDVLVIGGGIEGYSAALSALDTDPSTSVRILSRDAGRFAAESGLIDLLGYEPDGSGPVENPLSAIDRLPDPHLYGRLGLDTIRAALSLFDDAAGERYVGRETETNALLPTAVGRIGPAVRYPRTMANGVLSGPQSMRLAGFRDIVDFDAELAADRLDEETPLDVTGRTMDAPLSAGSVTEMARLLDENGVVGGSPARETFADAIAPTLDVQPRIGLPAVLGESETAAILASLEKQLCVSVFEVPLGPPSLPGRRLRSLFADAVESRGGAVESVAELGRAESSDGRIEGVLADGEAYEADSYVLATGGVGSGGLLGEAGNLREPVFDCPVSMAGDRFVDERFLGDHPAVRAGVEADDALRPVTSRGSPVAENLYAAGRVLESPSVVDGHAAGGFALATGYEAGRRACEQS
jgi:glycerol-3-phosphate dehydrogenase subunit B